MSPQTSQLREAMIKLAAMKIAYRRAWHNKKTPVTQLVSLLHEVEISEKNYRLLSRSLKN